MERLADVSPSDSVASELNDYVTFRKLADTSVPGQGIECLTLCAVTGARAGYCLGRYS